MKQCNMHPNSKVIEIDAHIYCKDCLMTRMQIQQSKKKRINSTPLDDIQKEWSKLQQSWGIGEKK